MAVPKEAPPALLFAAVFSRHEAAMDWGRDRLTETWGELLLVSPRFDHSETRYYEAEMGPGLQKQFLVFAGSFDPAKLAERKLQSNALEQDLVEQGRFPESRPLNIDPGYLTLTKIVLASAKDRAHRIYLSSGIYAEECLYYLDGGWKSRPWTYPDYQRSDFQDFFCEVRQALKRQIQSRN